VPDERRSECRLFDLERWKAQVRLHLRACRGRKHEQDREAEHLNPPTRSHHASVGAIHMPVRMHATRYSFRAAGLRPGNNYSVKGGGSRVKSAMLRAMFVASLLLLLSA